MNGPPKIILLQRLYHLTHKNRPLCLSGTGTSQAYLPKLDVHWFLTLALKTDSNGILHRAHVFDAATAYSATTEQPRDKVAREVFNISSRRSETTAKVAQVAAKSYNVKMGFLGDQPWNEKNPWISCNCS